MESPGEGEPLETVDEAGKESKNENASKELWSTPKERLGIAAFVLIAGMATLWIYQAADRNRVVGVAPTLAPAAVPQASNALPIPHAAPTPATDDYAGEPPRGMSVDEYWARREADNPAVVGRQYRPPQYAPPPMPQQGYAPPPVYNQPMAPPWESSLRQFLTAYCHQTANRKGQPTRVIGITMRPYGTGVAATVSVETGAIGTPYTEKVSAEAVYTRQGGWTWNQEYGGPPQFLSDHFFEDPGR